MNKILKAFKSTLPDRNKTEPYDTQAQVLRVEDGTAWVHIPGGVDETPVKLTIAAKPGDIVQVRVGGGRAHLTGNASAPPTDDTTAVAAQTEAKAAGSAAKEAQTEADKASRIAGNTNQYFWHTDTGTDTGAHITEVDQATFLADPANGGGNLLARSNGIAVRDGLTELATFSANGAQIGVGSGAHSVVDADGQRFYASDGTTQLANIGYGEGAAESGTAVAPYYTFGTRTSGSTIGNYSFAEGIRTAARASASHAEGNDTVASGSASHAEGALTIASGSASHAEGMLYAEESTQTTIYTTASGAAAHAEGLGTQATSRAAHAQNLGTAAYARSMTALGEFNIQRNSTSSRGDYAVAVGNGTANDNRSDALTVTWDGEVELYLNTSQTDYDKIYGEIVGAGWQSEVLAFPTTTLAMLKIKALLGKIMEKLSDFDDTFDVTPRIYKASVSGNSSVNLTWDGTLHANLTVTSASSGRLGVCAVYGNSAGTAVQTSTLPTNVTITRTASHVLTVTNSGTTSVYLRFLIFDGGLE